MERGAALPGHMIRGEGGWGGAELLGSHASVSGAQRRRCPPVRHWDVSGPRRPGPSCGGSESMGTAHGQTRREGGREGGAA